MRQRDWPEHDCKERPSEEAEYDRDMRTVIANGPDGWGIHVGTGYGEVRVAARFCPWCGVELGTEG